VSKEPHQAAEGKEAEDVPLDLSRLVQAGSISVPEDETCFFLYEASNVVDVIEATRRAGLPFGRIAEALAGRTGAAECL
jgi:hypothetical protein